MRMALNCGIVGLPNVGKSTIFSALSGCAAQAANYPFCTINPNTGIVNVPDERLARLSAVFKPARTIPATIEFVDIAGLVKGASKGEGLGNQFLSHIRETAVLAEVVRCFDDGDIVHVHNKVDPAQDMEVIALELALADMETLDKRKERASRALKVQAKAEQKEAGLVLSALEKIGPLLENGSPARLAPLSADEKEAVRDCNFITMKPLLYVCNTDEAAVRVLAAGGAGNGYIETVRTRAEAEGSQAVAICGKFEAELAEIAGEEEKRSFLADIGLKESGLSALIRAAYKLLGLATFFTAGEDECRAWTIRQGDTAPKAAGVIHTDFEKGFIKAETYSYDDFARYGTESKIKEAGRYRQEGKEYIVQDGDIMFFRFNR
jgi:GTP-binding protein YchF